MKEKDKFDSIVNSVRANNPDATIYAIATQEVMDQCKQYLPSDVVQKVLPPEYIGDDLKCDVIIVPINDETKPLKFAYEGKAYVSKEYYFDPDVNFGYWTIGE